MDLFNGMLAFVNVVDAGSFAGAARSLAIPKSTLSRRLERLEDRLGVQLLVRTTRRISLTDTGAAFLERSRRIVSDMQEAEESVQNARGTPRGLLRVSMPPPTGAPLSAELVNRYLATYPEVQLDVHFSARFVNLVREGFDIAFRAGTLDDSSLICRRVGSSELQLMASPDYLARRAQPDRPEELADHDLISSVARRWQTRDGDWIPIQPRLLVNDVDVARQAAVAGLGIAMLPTVFCVEDLRRGALKPVLGDHFSLRSSLNLIYPRGRHLSPKVRAFVDMAVEMLAELQSV